MPLTESEVVQQVCYFDTSIESLLKENKDKSINILWSGGCDSTLILYWILEWLKNLNDNRVINAYSFYHHQFNDNKMDWERQKRHRFIMWAEDKGFNNKISHHEISFSKDIINTGPSSCCQPAIWVSQIIPIIPYDCLLFAGYHKGDDFFAYNIFSNWLKAFTSINNLFGKTIKFYTPLVNHNKNEIIKLIKNIDGLYNNTWWCESVWSDGKPCGRCLPCEAHELALIYYERHKDTLSNKEVSAVVQAIESDPQLKDLVAKAATDEKQN